MESKILLIILFLLSLIATSSMALAVPEESHSVANSSQQVITLDDNGRNIILKNGEAFYLKLKENPSTGFSWQLNLSPGLSVQSDNYTQDPAPLSYVGVSGNHSWEIKVVATGSQQVKGIYRRPWENITGKEESFTLNINDVSQNTTSGNSDSGNGTSNIADVPTRIGGGSYAYITNEHENTLSVIDTTNDTVVSRVHVGSNPVGVAVSPDGTKVYVANYYGDTVSVIDTATNNVTATVNVGNNPNGIAVSPDGAKVYVTNLHSVNLSVIDKATNVVIDAVDAGSAPRGIAVSPDGTKIYVANSLTGAVFSIDAATNVVTDVAVGAGPYGIAVNPKGTMVYVTNEGDYPEYNGTVDVIDAANSTVTTRVHVGSNPKGVAVSPNGAKAYVTNEGNNSVSIIDTSTNNVIATVNVGANPNGIAVTPDGTKAYVANYHSNNVSVIDTALNEVTATVNVSNGPIGVAIGKLNVPPTETGNVVNIEPKSEPKQSPNISGKENMKTPGFEIVYGFVSLLAVFLHRTCKKR